MKVTIITQNGDTTTAVVTLDPPAHPIRETFEVTFDPKTYRLTDLFRRYDDYEASGQIDPVSPDEEGYPRLRHLLVQALRGHDPNSPVTYPRELPMGGHAFVWARPLLGAWSKYDGKLYSTDEEKHGFRPCMVSGQYSGQRITVFGSTLSYPLADFEISRDVEPPPVRRT